MHELLPWFEVQLLSLPLLHTLVPSLLTLTGSSIVQTDRQIDSVIDLIERGMEGVTEERRGSEERE